MPFPTYNKSEFPGGVMDLQQLHEELSGVSFTVGFVGVTQDLELITVELDASPSQDDIDLVDSIVLSHNYLRAYKKRAADVIDRRTERLIEVGFEFPTSSGIYFSLSVNSQVKIIGAHEARDDPSFEYPVVWNSVHNMDRVVIPDSTTLHAFFIKAITTYRVILDQGTTLKTQIRNASSIAEVDAVVDNR